MFTLDQLHSDKVVFRFGENEIYFRTTKDFDFQEYAAWQRLQKELVKITDLRKKAKTDDQYARAEKKNQTLCREVVALCLPEFPSNELENLNIGQVDRLAGMCIKVATGVYGRTRVDNEVIQQLKEQYPDLPEPFIYSLTRNQAALLIEDDEAKND